MALFPCVYVFHRVRNADVVFALTDRRLDDKNHVNRCVIRSAAGSIGNLEIPVCRKGHIDAIEVPERSTWLPTLQQELRRPYRGLPMASAAYELVSESMSLPFTSTWLCDYLMHAFATTLRYLGPCREIVRGPTEQRQRWLGDSHYLLELCAQTGCTRLLVGRGSEIKDRSLLQKAGITIEFQDWPGTTTLRAKDSILDAVARFSPADILVSMRKGN